MFICYMVFKSGHAESVSSDDPGDVNGIAEAMDEYYRGTILKNISISPIHDFCGVIRINLSELAFVAVNEVDEGGGEDA